jgi:hypothetical protein
MASVLVTISGIVLDGPRSIAIKEKAKTRRAEWLRKRKEEIKEELASLKNGGALETPHREEEVGTSVSNFPSLVLL